MKYFSIIACLFVMFFASSAQAQMTAQRFGQIMEWVVQPESGSGMPAACWFCPLYREIFQIMNTMVTETSTSLTGYFQILLWLGGLFLIVFYFGKLFISLKEIAMGDMLRGLAVPVGKLMLASLLLANIHTIYFYIVDPALTMSLGLGSELMGPTQSLQRLQAVASVGVSQGRADDRASWQRVQSIVNGAVTCDGLSDIFAQNSAFFSNRTYRGVQCLMSRAGASLSSGMALGLTILQWALDDWTDRFKAIWIGLLVAGCYFFLLVMIGMKLIDPLVRLTVVSALMPLWVVLWAFPATAGYTKKAWEALINVMGTFIFFSVIMCVIEVVMAQALGGENRTNTVFAHIILNTSSENMFRNFGWREALWCFGYTMVCFQMLNSMDSLVQTFAAGGADMGVAKALEGLTMKITNLGANLARGATGLGKSAVAGTWTGIKYGSTRFSAWREARKKEHESPSAGPRPSPGS